MSDGVGLAKRSSQYILSVLFLKFHLVIIKIMNGGGEKQDKIEQIEFE